MNLLDLISGRMFKAARSKGGEYHGPCPVCGGNDRFHVWPEQGEQGSFWCRGCDIAGDAIQYLRVVEGLSFRQACEKLGKDADATRAAQSRSERPAGFQPATVVSPADLWQGKATAFADYCHTKLMATPEQLAWLAGRGITPDVAAHYRLGWNPSDVWRERSAWGLPEEIKPETGKPKKLWLPKGLVIPVIEQHRAVQLRIRRPEGEPRYFVVPGSSRQPLISRPDASAYVVVESGLDAILLDASAGDLVGVIAMHNDSAKPPASLFEILTTALHISVAMDSDKITRNKATGKLESAGAKASRWWIHQFPQAERTPIIGGKDPGEAYQAGVNLRDWVLAGLPPKYQVLQGVGQLMSYGNQPAPVPVPPPTTSTESTPSTKSTPIITAPDGRTFRVVEDRQEWQAEVAAGRLVFSALELARLQAALVTPSPQLAALVLDIKEVFHGAYIKAGRVGSSLAQFEPPDETETPLITDIPFLPLLKEVA